MNYYEEETSDEDSGFETTDHEDSLPEDDFGLEDENSEKDH